MTSQKTIERCRKERDDLKIANTQLLESNLSIAEENIKLRSENKTFQKRIDEDNYTVRKLKEEKEQCTLRYKAIVSEKEQELQKKQQYISNLHDTIWHLRNSFKCTTYEFSETPAGFKLELNFGRKQ